MNVLARVNFESGIDQPHFKAVLALALLGFTATVGQIALIRELIIFFNGNELSVGIMLATWLFWTAIGSALTRWLASDGKNIRRYVAGFECLCGLSLPLTVVAVRMAGTRLRTVPDELLGIVPMALISLTCLSAFCSVSGCLFVLGVRLYQQTFFVSGQTGTSCAYMFETAGAGLGGILTSILLLQFFGSLQIAMMIMVLNVAVALWLLTNAYRFKTVGVALGAVAAVIPLIIHVAPRLDYVTQNSLWQRFHVLDSRDTIYGRLTIVESGGMRSIYDNGSILANVPDPAAGEEAVHYALLEHPGPRRILLIGGGVSGGITEALKHPTLEHLDDVELDPELIEIFRKYFPAESAHAFSDRRVHLHFLDGRLYLTTTAEKYDVIILNVPSPENAQLNRFYTAEFFRSVRNHLAAGGIFALQLRSSEDHIGPKLAEFLQCIHKTLQSVFPNVATAPGATLHMFGSEQSGVLTEDPNVLIARLRARNLDTLYVREYFLPYRMSSERMAQIGDVLRPLPQTGINRDFHPIAYYFGTVLWSAQFDSSYAQLLEDAGRIGFSRVLAGVIAFVVLVIVLLLLTSRSRWARVAALWSAGATGYTLMALQILLLLAFQSVYGYVYQELAMTIGMFMAGISMGTWLGARHTRAADRRTHTGKAALNQLLLGVTAPMFLIVMMQLAEGPGGGTAIWVARYLFPVLAAVCGIPGGYQFSFAAASYLRDRDTYCGSGTLYALDLIGGCAGALLLAGVLIPVFGFWSVAWLTTVVNVAAVFLFALSGRATG